MREEARGSGVVNSPGVRSGMLSSLARMVASHPPAKGLRRWLRLKEEASEQFPPVRGFSFTSPTHESSTERLDSYCVEKKEAPESTDSENEEAPHGGSGASRVPRGEPVMAWAPSHYSLTPFTGSLCQAFCLTRQRLSLSVAMFHYYDRSDPSATGAKSLTART